MTVHLGAEEFASASVDLRPFCLNRSACSAKTPGKHCLACSIKSPQRNARIGATMRAIGQISRAAYMAQTKVCDRCGVTFSPRPTKKIKQSSWEKRRYCSRSCSGPAVMEDPTNRRAHRTAVIALFDDLDFRARHAAAAAINAKEASRHADPKKSAATRVKRMIGWIPDDFMPRYKRMREQFGAAKAKAMIREAMAVQARRDIAAADRAMRERHARELASRY